jgi:hypothetical protein
MDYISMHENVARLNPDKMPLIVLSFLATLLVNTKSFRDHPNKRSLFLLNYERRKFKIELLSSAFFVGWPFVVHSILIY